MSRARSVSLRGATTTRAGSLLAVCCLALVMAAACRQRDPAPPLYQVLSEHAEELRARFNADQGAVRVIMLVSPS